MRLLALLSICLSTTALIGYANGVVPAKSEMAGDWEEDPGTCEGDNAVSYRLNGRFYGYDYEGRWKLTGQTLTTFVTKQMDSDEKWGRVKNPERIVTVIISLTSDRLIERWADGSVHQFHRCR